MYRAISRQIKIKKTTATTTKKLCFTDKMNMQEMEHV